MKLLTLALGLCLLILLPSGLGSLRGNERRLDDGREEDDYHKNDSPEEDDHNDDSASGDGHEDDPPKGDDSSPECTTFAQDSGAEWADMTAQTIQSSHPYCNNMSVTQKYVFNGSGVVGVSVHVDSSTKLEKEFDFLKFSSDQEGRKIIKNFGCNVYKDFVIKGNTFYLNFKSDEMVTDHGYKVTLTPLTTLPDEKKKGPGGGKHREIGDECLRDHHEGPWDDEHEEDDKHDSDDASACASFWRDGGKMFDDVKPHVIESPHTYCNNLAVSQQYGFKDSSVTGVLVEFDPKTSIERKYDELKFGKSSADSIKRFVCNKFHSFIIPGKEFALHFSTDNFKVDYGYKFTVTPIVNNNIDQSQYDNAEVGDECLNTDAGDGKEGEQGTCSNADLKTKAKEWLQKFTPSVIASRVDQKTVVSLHFEQTDDCIKKVVSIKPTYQVGEDITEISHEKFRETTGTQIHVYILDADAHSVPFCQSTHAAGRVFFSCPILFQGSVSSDIIKTWQYFITFEHTNNTVTNMSLNAEPPASEQTSKIKLNKSHLSSKKSNKSKKSSKNPKNKSDKFKIGQDVTLSLPIPDDLKDKADGELQKLILINNDKTPKQKFYITKLAKTTPNVNSFSLEIPLIFASKLAQIDVTIAWKLKQAGDDGSGAKSRMLEDGARVVTYSTELEIEGESDGGVGEKKGDGKDKGMGLKMILGLVVVGVVVAAIVGGVVYYKKLGKRREKMLMPAIPVASHELEAGESKIVDARMVYQGDELEMADPKKLIPHGGVTRGSTMAPNDEDDPKKLLPHGGISRGITMDPDDDPKKLFPHGGAAPGASSTLGEPKKITPGTSSTPQ
mmetsp:Transcript_31254/g.35590  ORF Transcript_31254/g.35590 Transcript_31254/m.35590 type:complete len:839 (+) Transcript_31254:75-2591(+)